MTGSLFDLDPDRARALGARSAQDGPAVGEAASAATAGLVPPRAVAR